MLSGLAVLAVAGCGDTNEGVEQPPEGAILEPEGPEGDPSGALVVDDELGADAVQVVSAGGNVRFDPGCLITESSVAGISIPDTLGDFVSAFPDGTVLSFYPEYMVDFGKLCLRAGGADALCADFESYNVEVYHPDIAVVGLSVYAPQCRTAEGVGPGSAASAAVDAYGAPTFAFNYDNEGREYASFADQPDGLAFRARSGTAEADTGSPVRPNGPYAGKYEGVEGDGSYFETGDYHSDGEIREVFLSAPLDPTE